MKNTLQTRTSSITMNNLENKAEEFYKKKIKKQCEYHEIKLKKLIENELSNLNIEFNDKYKMVHRTRSKF